MIYFAFKYIVIFNKIVIFTIFYTQIWIIYVCVYDTTRWAISNDKTLKDIEISQKLCLQQTSTIRVSFLPKKQNY